MEPVDGQRFFNMAETYDRMCQLLVPQYDFFQDEVLRMLPHRDGRSLTFVDLGAGSGIMLERILTRWPRAVCYWVDYSQDFLRVAQKRLARFDGSIEYILSPIEEGWEDQIDGQVEVIFSMSAIHHLEEEEKKALYQRCWDKLVPDGWFLNVDEMKTMYRGAYLTSMRFWIRHVRDMRDGMSPELLPYYEKWKAHFDRWEQRNVDHIGQPKAKGDDLHDDFTSQVRWLKEIGFVDVDVFVKYHLWCMVGGHKPASLE